MRKRVAKGEQSSVAYQHCSVVLHVRSDALQLESVGALRELDELVLLWETPLFHEIHHAHTRREQRRRLLVTKRFALRREAVFPPRLRQLPQDVKHTR